MSKVLDTDQREQAGSSSYNKFEYQVYWIVYRIIENIKNEKNCVVFCEYHDDMVEYDKSKNFKFFQIKTKEKIRIGQFLKWLKKKKIGQVNIKNHFLDLFFIIF